MKRILLVLLLIASAGAGLWFGARHEVGSAAIPMVDRGADAAAHGAAAFIGADFGGLSLKALQSHALPWKLVTAALVLQAVDTDGSVTADRATLNSLLAEFGFLVEARVANLPGGVSSRPDGMPLGLTHAVLFPVAGAPVLVSNLGCAACHGGVIYDAEGRPDSSRAWIGMPNSSINLEAYTLAVFRALKAYRDAPDRLMGMVTALYPETGWREVQTLRWLVMPLVQARLDEIPGDRPLPFPNGVPGSTNGVAALKHSFGVPLIGGGARDAGVVSIPDLGYRHWRNSLLVDGAYAVPGQDRQVETTPEDNTPEKQAALAAMTTFFTVPSMGVHPDRAIEAVPVAEDIYAFLGSAYAPQPFPGEIDADLAAKGGAIYAAECSACHGTYTMEAGRPALVSFPNWLGDVETDPLRAEAFSEDLVETFRKTAYRDRIDAARTQAYAAPPLSGIWASAPYLHNGSVPTIRGLLTPAARPDTFEVGGHALDFDHLGLHLQNGRYPKDYDPFSRPVLIDTSQPGLSNEGHEFGADLSELDKDALIAFLKQL